jgi:3-hydroxyacyl-CoA dehydrogenase/enoyl-CoA hydratase/3-hydroxybutyryl-CoA epimerase
LFRPIVEEARLCLKEGVAARAEDIDLAMVMGTGFAPFRGGPMRWAEDDG